MLMFLRKFCYNIVGWVFSPLPLPLTESFPPLPDPRDSGICGTLMGHPLTGTRFILLDSKIQNLKTFTASLKGLDLSFVLSDLCNTDLTNIFYIRRSARVLNEWSGVANSHQQ